MQSPLTAITALASPVVIAAVLVMGLATTAIAKEVQGKVTHVRDADSIEVNNIPIRFNGVDAPDKGQPGFEEGKEWMKHNYAGRMVRCVLTVAKTYDRWVGTCYGTNGEIPVRTGYLASIEAGHKINRLDELLP